MRNYKLTAVFSFLLLFNVYSFAKLPNHFESRNGYTGEKPFVTVSLIGGLGNLLFEVSTACAVAWDNDAEPCFPDFKPIANQDSFKHIFFRLNINQPKNPIQYVCNRPCFEYDPIPYHPNMRINGYVQNDKYFAHHRNRLVELFAPHPNDLNYIQNKYGWIINHPNSVSVHLRYYYAEKPDEDCFVQYDWEYFEKAMSLFPNTSLFVVTSDNVNFARQNISTDGRNVVFIEKEPHFIDFYLQSMCKHSIICNSTFSWWSAWLNQNPNKVVVRPKVWLAGYPDMDGPDDWIKIDAIGMQERKKQK